MREHAKRIVQEHDISDASGGLATTVHGDTDDCLFELKQAGKKFSQPHHIKVKIGAPVRFPPHADPEWIARDLQKKVEEL